ncbi:MAG: ATP-binding protein, partial [Pseudomonas sp.]|nr:ATP-binding protein [Pseudomonas sp.]
LRQQGDPPLQDWADTVREVALDLAPLIADAGLDFELDTQSCPVLGHPWALRELVRNLLHNAVKHSPPLGQLSVSLRNNGDQAELAISDSGPGIAAELREGLFLRPFNIGGARRDGGLGLRIVHRILQLHGREIRLIDIPGQGATFRFSLPVDEETAGQLAIRSMNLNSPGK